MQPRFIRRKDAPTYLGMCSDIFEASVRPCLTEIPIGERGIAFDRLDLDAWADEHKASNGRPKKHKELSPWDERERGASPSKKTAAEPSTRSGEGKESSPDSGKSRRTKRHAGLVLRGRYHEHAAPNFRQWPLPIPAQPGDIFVAQSGIDRK